MDKIVIQATKRVVTGKQVGALRREGKLPAVVYGHKVDPTPITMDFREASRALVGLSGSSIITLDIDGKEVPVLVREKQLDYLRNIFIHVDFQAISLNEKIRAKVEIVHTGVAPAVKDFNGVVVTGISEIEVEALPKDLPERFIIDLSILKNIGDAIYLKDIPLPEGVEMLSSPEEMVINVTFVEEEKEVEAVEEGIEEPEVIERGKKEEEEEEK